jgi:ribosomal protein S24E
VRTRKFMTNRLLARKQFVSHLPLHSPFSFLL